MKFERIYVQFHSYLKIYCRFADNIYSVLYLFDKIAGQGRRKTIIQRNEAMG